MRKSTLLMITVLSSSILNAQTAIINYNNTWKYLDNGTANSCIYTKNGTDVVNGIVYAVVGSAGQLGGTTAGYPHDAMYYSDVTNGGTLFFEVENNRLDAKWICSDGVIRDNFTIMKEINKTNNITIASGTPTQLTASWIGNYSWSTTESTKTISVSPTTNTTYTVTDGAGCITDVFNITISGARNIFTAAPRDAPANTVLKVMPTLPKQGEKVIVQTNLIQQARVSVIDINGRVVQTFNFIHTLYIPTEKLQPGVYFVRLDGKQKSEVHKFVVVK